MAKATYIGVNNVAKKVKNIYVGVDGKARKVKRGYIGVNGVARLFWKGIGDLSYYKTLTGSSTRADNIMSANAGNYLLFGGGDTNLQFPTEVEAFNTSLTRSLAPDLPYGTDEGAGIGFGEYAIFGPGMQKYHGQWENDSFHPYITVYNASLTQSTIRDIKRGYYAVSKVGNYALIAGGEDIYAVTDEDDWTSIYTDYSTVTALNASLTRTTTNLAQTKRGLYGVG